MTPSGSTITAVGWGTLGLLGLTRPQDEMTWSSGSESSGKPIRCLPAKDASLSTGSGLTAQISTPSFLNVSRLFCSSPSWPRQKGHHRPR